jgi:hypothetical protein
MGRPLKIKKTTTKDIGFNSVGSTINPVFPGTLNSDQFLGVVGGTSTVATTAYPVVKCVVNITGSGEGVEVGIIVRQKGSTKYLVTGATSGDTGVCVLADDATPAEGFMAIIMESGDSAQVNIAKLTNKWATDYNDVRYVINFFTDEGTEIKSGTVGVTNELAMIESLTS